MACVYFIQASRLRLIKIGRATDPVERVSALRTGSPDALSLLAFIRCDDMAAAAILERDLHRQFQSDRSHGEWFEPTGALLRLIQERDTEAADDEHKRLYLRALAMCHTPKGKRRLRDVERQRRAAA
jgi:hypothetical protein